MKRVRMALAIAAAVAMPGVVSAAELFPGTMDSGVHSCPGNGETDWFNSTGITLRIKQITLWAGLLSGTHADIGATVLTGKGPMVVFGNDRYADTSEQPTHVWNYAPDYVALEPGDSLQLRWSCNSNQATQTQLGVSFLYTVTP